MVGSKGRGPHARHACCFWMNICVEARQLSVCRWRRLVSKHSHVLDQDRPQTSIRPLSNSTKSTQTLTQNPPNFPNSIAADLISIDSCPRMRPGGFLVGPQNPSVSGSWVVCRLLLQLPLGAQACRRFSSTRARPSRPQPCRLVPRARFKGLQRAAGLGGRRFDELHLGRFFRSPAPIANYVRGANGLGYGEFGLAWLGAAVADDSY